MFPSVCLSVFARNIKCIEHFPQLNRKSCVERSNSKFQGFSCSANKHSESVFWVVEETIKLASCGLTGDCVFGVNILNQNQSKNKQRKGQIYNTEICLILNWPAGKSLLSFCAFKMFLSCSFGNVNVFLRVKTENEFFSVLRMNSIASLVPWKRKRRKRRKKYFNQDGKSEICF